MVVIDTNVLVRFLAQDDPAQTARAIQLIEVENVWVSMTVLLEAEWVMRRILGMKSARILALLRAFVGIRNVNVENPLRLANALELSEDGMDFADALHLSATEPGQRFATFDKALLRAARRAAIGGVFSP